jgi:hypothetical protein
MRTDLNLYRISWAESRLCHEVERGQQEAWRVPTVEVKTQAHCLRHAIKNTQDGDKRFYDATMWRVLRVEQYDYKAKVWTTIKLLKGSTMYRDYASNIREPKSQIATLPY